MRARKTARAVALVGLVASGVGLVGAGSAQARTDGGRGGAPVVRVVPVSPMRVVASSPVRVEASALRLRTAPNTSHALVRGLLWRGDRVRVTEPGPVMDGYRWEQVRVYRSAGGLRSGVSGWVAARYVSTPHCPTNWVPWTCR